MYYRSFGEVLAEHFINAFNHSSHTGCMSPDLLRAHVTVIPKEGKDPLHCASYRPISLLNVDLKIFTKILASRLSPLLPILIDPDQVGFVPTREAKENTTKVLNLIHLSAQGSIPSVFLSTDAEKAFDRVNWDFLLTVLRHVGLGSSMLNWVSAIYSCPSASVKANGVLSDYFRISNGTRQGCPLSPLLFALYLEPFLCTIRKQPDIAGIPIPGSQIKVSAYADDLLFSLTNPSISLPVLLQEFHLFGRLADLKINTHKSVALMVAMPLASRTNLESSFPFRWASEALPYLGTLLPADPTKTFLLNFPPLLRTVGKMLQSWSPKMLSWFGRCNVLKMTILPKFLYLISALPIFIPQQFFRSVHTLFVNFIWANKRPRIRRQLMTLPKPYGGLAVPDIKIYYLASHLTRVLSWTRKGEAPGWLRLEELSSITPLWALPWCQSPIPNTLRHHPTISATLKACAVISRTHKLFTNHSLLYPVLGNASFPMGITDKHFLALGNRGYRRVEHFIVEGHWPSISALMDHEGPFSLDFWRALQLSHFLRSLPAVSSFSSARDAFEALCDGTEHTRHSLSLLYQLLIAPPQDFCIPGLLKWERDLQVTFSPQERANIIQQCFKSSVCTSLQELNYKILSRWYRTPTVLHSFHPTVPSSCWRCGVEDGTLLHIFWSCAKLTPFWTNVHSIVQRFSDTQLPFDPAFYLLHHSSFSHNSYARSVLRHLLNAAKACIPLLWRKEETPSISLWLKKVEEIRRMEELIASPRGTHESFRNMWFYWIDFALSPEGRSMMYPQDSSI